MSHHFGFRYVEELLSSPNSNPPPLPHHNNNNGAVSVSPVLRPAIASSQHLLNPSASVVPTSASTQGGIKHSIQSIPSPPLTSSDNLSPLNRYYPTNSTSVSKDDEVSIIEHTLNEINSNNIAYKHRLNLLLPRSTICGDLIANPILSD